MRLWKRFRFALRRRLLERELAGEMQAHRAMLEERLRAEGMSAEDARFAALRQFGGQLSNIEQSRDEWGWRWLDSLMRDVRFAARMILHRRALTATAVLTLALGVGANTAVTGVLRTMLLNPLGLCDSGNVMVATVRIEKLHMKNVETSAAEYRDLKAMNDVFSAVAAVEGRYWTAQLDGEPVRLRGRAVTSDFFRVFRESPALGRFLVPEDRESAVLSWTMWRTQYGADRNVIGRPIELDGTLYRVVGVAPAGFRYPASAQLWTSLVMSPERLNRRGYNMNLRVLVRLQNGVSPAQASDRVNRYIKAITSPAGDARGYLNYGYFVDLQRFAEHVAGDLRQPLWILWAAALVVLFTGCANIATLLLSRAGARKREMAIRLSLGATRLQILRQLLVESVLLGLLGGIGGVAVAAAGTALLHRAALPGRDSLALVALDQPLIVYGLALSLASGIVFGIAPAVQLLRDSQTAAMARASRHRYQGVFVAAEVAAALVLVISTGLLLRTLLRLGQIDPGFQTRNVATTFLLKPRNDPTFVERLDARIRALPGIESAALAFPIPFSGGGLTSSFSIRGRERQRGEPEWHGEAYFVSPTYFDTLRIPVLAGRVFSDVDSARAPRVCVIDAKLAAKFFPGQDPVGKEIAMYGGWARVVGIVKTIRATTIDQESRPVVYYPLVQVPYFPQAAVIVRSAQPATALIREVVRQTNGSAPLYDSLSLEQRLKESLGVRQVMAALVSVFAAICLFLAAVGLHGVLSQLVGDRAPEIGVRMALGARPVQILTHFLRYGIVWGGLGVGIGLAAARYAQNWLADLLFEIRPFDPGTFIAAAIGVLMIALTAVWWPAWRASRIAPQSVLRHE